MIEKHLQSLCSGIGTLPQLERNFTPAFTVYARNRKTLSKHAEKPSLFFAEIPLLFETGAEGYFDYVVTVIASPEACRERFFNKGISKKEYFNRMKRQWPPEKKASESHFVIENNKDLDFLKIQVDQLFHSLTH